MDNPQKQMDKKRLEEHKVAEPNASKDAEKSAKQAVKSEKQQVEHGKPANK